jgi:transposase InsO family protein
MKKNKEKYSVTKMAKLLGLSRSAYYRWEKYGFSDRQARMDAELEELLRNIHKEHPYYGSPRILAELRETYCLKINKKRVSRLLKKYGLNAKTKRKFVKTTDSAHDLAVCENILNRDFAASEPGEKWVSDITYLPTRDGWRYLTTVLDLFDRKIIGYAYRKTMETIDTTVKAYEAACLNRRPKLNLIFHSDRGVQYCSHLFREKLESRCPTVRQSMSRKGNCWDNACAESFFKTLKKEVEVLDGKHSAFAVQEIIFYYIEAYYNRKRRHSAIDYKVPVEVLCKKVA